MTVKELIEQLEKWPKDNDVIVYIGSKDAADFLNIITGVFGIETNFPFPNFQHGKTVGIQIGKE